ncbi:MAG: ATP-binding protein [Myxococcota bacterium]
MDSADRSPSPTEHGTPLGSLLRRHTLGTALVPLLVVEISLLALYFVLGQEVAGRWRQEVITSLRRGLQEVADTRAQQLALTLADIQHQTDLVRAHAGQLLRGEVLPTEPYHPEHYAVSSRGSLYQRVDDGGASIYYAAKNRFTATEERKIAITEPLDASLKRAVTNDPHVVAAYLNTYDDFNRYYPFIPNAAEQFPPDLDMEAFAFYYAADAAHNPARAVVWTDAYLDPAGNGWMVSSVAPVYRGDVLEGVVGLDVTIPVIATRVLDLDLPYEALALLITPEGSLLGLNRGAAKRFPEGTTILDEPPPGIDQKERILDEETPLARLLGDAEAAQQMLALSAQDTGLTELTLHGEPFFLLHASVAQPPWTLAVLVSTHEALAPVEAIESSSGTLTVLIIGGMGVFYALFFSVIYRRSRRLATRVVTPIGALTEATEATEPPPSTLHSGVSEIDRLGASFREMVATNRAHQQRIEALNRDLEGQVREEVRKNREKDHLLLEQSRLASLGEMVASIAHQWRQPLASLQFMLSDMRMWADEPAPLDASTLREYVDDAEQLIQHMDQTVDDFRTLYQNTPDPHPIELRAVVDQALGIADGSLKAAGVRVTIEDHAPGATTHGRANELCHVLLNLVSNAQAVLTERAVRGAQIVVRIGRADEQPRPSPVLPPILPPILEIEDNAGGVDPAIAPRLFDPFVTGRKEGTGLGLYMSRRLIQERFGGRLTLRDGAAGACFRIELPSPRSPDDDELR